MRVSQNTFIWIDPDSTDFIMCAEATTRPEDGGVVHMMYLSKPLRTYVITLAKFAKLNKQACGTVEKFARNCATIAHGTR